MSTCLKFYFAFEFVSDFQVYSSLADRFSIGLWKRVDKQTKRDELAVDGSQLNFVVYHGHDDNLLVSVSFTPGQEGWYTAQINLDGQPILYGKDLTLIVLSSGMLLIKKAQPIRNQSFKEP